MATSISGDLTLSVRCLVALFKSNVFSSLLFYFFVWGGDGRRTWKWENKHCIWPIPSLYEIAALRLHRGFNHLIPLLVPWAGQSSAATIVPGSKAIPKDMFHSERWVCPNRTQTGLVLGVWGYCSLSCPIFFFSTLELNSALDITASPAGPSFFLMEVRDVFWAHNGGKVVFNYPCTVCAKDLALQKSSGTMKSPFLTYQEVPSLRKAEWGKSGRNSWNIEIWEWINEWMNGVYF